jgi:hypothetical protein
MKTGVLPIFVLLFAQTIQAEEKHFPHLAIIFSAKEISETTESKAYTFDLYCQNKTKFIDPKESYCTLNMMRYDECITTENKSSFDAIPYKYSTKDNSLSVESVNPKSIELKFSSKGIFDDSYSISISLAESGVPGKLKSAIGWIERKHRHSEEGKLIRMRALNAPGEELTRSCPIYLPTF